MIIIKHIHTNKNGNTKSNVNDTNNDHLQK